MTRKNPVRDLFDRVRPRMRPRFVIIGAQKAGTSALYEMFRHHPKALPPDTKELDYFNDDVAYAKGYHAYATRFPAIPIKSRGHFTFEASPSYMYHAAKCAPRIAKDLPATTCIAILRDPVKRAFSAWNMFRNFKAMPKYSHLHDARSFAQAVEDELAGRTIHDYHKYLARGLYSDQLVQFSKHVGKDCLIIKSYTELKNNPGAFTNDILDKLQLPRFRPETVLNKIKANEHPYVNKLDSRIAEQLYTYYMPEITKLKEMLGKDIDFLENHG